MKKAQLITEYVDVEDANGSVIGKLDLSTMRAVAPNQAVDEAVANGETIYMRKNGIRSILSPQTLAKKRR